MDKDHIGGTGYVTHEHHTVTCEHGEIINLGLGTSPIGAAPELKLRLARRDLVGDLEEYSEDPFHTKTKGFLLNYIGVSAETRQVVFGGNGSYGTGDEVIRYLSRSHNCNRIITLPYSFPNTSQWAIRHGLDSTCHGTVERSWEENLATLTQRNDLAGSVVYIDYPNNPSGQSGSSLLNELIPFIANRGGVPFIDMAFAEVLGDEFKNVAKTTLNNQGIIIGSVSKTQGLPGLRAGWIILSEEHINNGYTPEQQLVFGINREAEEVMQALYSNLQQDGSQTTLADVHARRVSNHNVVVNQELSRTVTELGLHLLPSDLRTSIQVIYDPGGRNLYNAFMQAGIIIESLKDYDSTLPSHRNGYGNSAIRILTPNFSKLDMVLDRIGLAVREYL